MAEDTAQREEGASTPEIPSLRGARPAAMVWAVLFFGFFSVLVLVDQAGQLLGG